jgi:hypothetical protein
MQKSMNDTKQQTVFPLTVVYLQMITPLGALCSLTSFGEKALNPAFIHSKILTKHDNTQGNLKTK